MAALSFSVENDVQTWRPSARAIGQHAYTYVFLIYKYNRALSLSIYVFSFKSIYIPDANSACEELGRASSSAEEEEEEKRVIIKKEKDDDEENI